MHWEQVKWLSHPQQEKSPQIVYAIIDSVFLHLTRLCFSDWAHVSKNSVYPWWPQRSITNTWPSKLLSNLHSQSLTASAEDTEAVNSYHIPYKRLFSGGKLLWTGRSCEDFSPSLLLCLSSGNQWECVCVETEERPLLARGSTEPSSQLSRTCYPAQALYCFIPSHLYRLFFIQRWLYGVVLLRSVLSSPLYDYLPLISPM